MVLLQANWGLHFRTNLALRVGGVIGILSPLVFLFCNCTGTTSTSSVGSACSTTGTYNGTASLASWSLTKATQAPINQLSSVYNTPYAQPVSTLAWEDGIYISRDGLNLYAGYFPMDSLSVILASQTPATFYQYERGPLIGQNFTNPFGYSYPWIHADMVYAHRTSTAGSFTCWTLSGLADATYDRSAPVGILNTGNASYRVFMYTDDNNSTSQNPNGGTKIMMATNEPLSPSVAGSYLPANVNETAYHQDNPHVEAWNSGAPNDLVLFYESDNKPGGAGGIDIWYSTSTDGGTTWTNPAAVTTVNTSGPDEQPHLYYDGSSWWLYWTANYSDGKLAIYRAQQQTAGNWDSWGTKQVVVSAGTTAGVGEPSLTSSGDLSFVVVYQNSSGGTSTDKYDADPWYMQHK